jgi:hypothetical protein
MTHKDLVKNAVSWLKNNQRCTIVINELRSTYVSECPDAIGFKGGISILVECKASRADFLSDSKKYFRNYSDYGMGNFRYYMAPVRLIKTEELPPNWGLIEVYESQSRVKHKPEMFEEANKQGEVAMLTSVIRRLEISTAVFVRYEDDNQPLNTGAKDSAG